MSVVTAPTIAGPAPPNWFGTWQVLAAFNNSLFDDLTAITTTASPPGTLGAHNVWTDITKYVLTLHSRRGRQHEIFRKKPHLVIDDASVRWQGRTRQQRVTPAPR